MKRDWCVDSSPSPHSRLPRFRNLRTRTFRRTIVLIPRGTDHAWTTALDRTVLGIPPASLSQNAHPSMSHVSPAFAPVFGDCLRYLRKLLYTEKGQPFIIAGSGTLGWDLVAANCAFIPCISTRRSKELTFPFAEQCSRLVRRPSSSTLATLETRESDFRCVCRRASEYVLRLIFTEKSALTKTLMNSQLCRLPRDLRRQGRPDRRSGRRTAFARRGRGRAQERKVLGPDFHSRRHLCVSLPAL